MKVSFLTFDTRMASARYRQLLPVAELLKLGVDVGPKGDIVVCSKHSWPLNLVEGYKHIVYDVCDDYFNDEYDEFYRNMIALADAVVCNSAAMQWRIWEETGVHATIIPDPYEMEEREPSFGEGLMWFGHELNLPDLMREIPKLKPYEMAVVSKPIVPGITPWSPEATREALDACGVVILPTGKSPCKSANRMIEAIRRGKFVVANPLPAYAEFSPFVWIGDLRAGVDWAFENKETALEMVSKAQDYIRNRYSPARIGRLWLGVLEGVSARESKSISPTVCS